MARTPRHSKPKSESITIDLDEKDVKPIADNIENEGEDQEDAITPDENAAEDNSKEAAGDEQEQPSTPEQSKTSGSTFSAGILGAVLALVGAAGLQWSGFLPGADNGQQNTVATLEQKVATLEENLGQANNQIAERLTIQPTGDFSSLTARVDALEKLLQNDNASSLEALNEIKIQIDQLTSKIINVETSVANAGTEIGDLSLPDNLTAEINKLTTSNVEQAEKIADLQAQIVSLAQSTSQDSQTSQIITDLQKRLAEAETAIAEPRNDISIARSLAATAVKSAINRGGSFVAELEAFSQIDPEHSAIAELKPLSEQGVLKRVDLVASFSAIANQIIAADSDVEADTGIMSRLMNSAASMVKIRKVGEIEGDTAEAIVARIETRLNDGKLTDAAREWDKLSDKAKIASEGFQTQLNARILAENLSDKLMQADPANAG